MVEKLNFEEIFQNLDQNLVKIPRESQRQRHYNLG